MPALKANVLSKSFYWLLIILVNVDECLFKREVFEVGFPNERGSLSSKKDISENLDQTEAKSNNKSNIFCKEIIGCSKAFRFIENYSDYVKQAGKFKIINKLKHKSFFLVVLNRWVK